MPLLPPHPSIFILSISMMPFIFQDKPPWDNTLFRSAQMNKVILVSPITSYLTRAIPPGRASCCGPARLNEGRIGIGFLLRSLPKPAAVLGKVEMHNNRGCDLFHSGHATTAILVALKTVLGLLQDDLVVHQGKLLDPGLQDLALPEDVLEQEPVFRRLNPVHALQYKFFYFAFA
jgi:hypothetical protein